MKLSLVFSTLVSLSTLVSSADLRNRQAKKCKVIPGSVGWPTEAQWSALNTQVGGRLLKPEAPGASCIRGSKTYNSGSCSSVTSGFGDSSWHANNPVSNMWQNYNNYTCVPGSGACSGAGYPVYVLEASNAADIKAVIDFARLHDVRVNIKSTGHDFLGRSVQPYSVSIWTHKLKKLEWYSTSFTPKGCKTQIPGAAVRTGSGSNWNELGSSARGEGQMLVGGAFGSVSVGGYIQNGGHGGLSAKYGLGADQVLEIDLVTPQGEIITANECQNTDYFWAIRGGGGSTYGVVVNFVLHAIPTVRTARYSGSVHGWDEITYLHKSWSKIAMLGGAGYFSGYPGRGGAVSWSVSAPNVTQAALRAVIDPILDGMSKLGGRGSRSAKSKTAKRIDSSGAKQVDSSNDESDEPEQAYLGALNSARLVDGVSVSAQRGEYKEFATWGDAENSLGGRQEKYNLEKRAAQASFPGMGENKILATWLYSHQDTQSPNLKKALMGAIDDTAWFLNDATMGIGTHNPPYIRGGGNAVNPAFRTAVMRPATELQWSGTSVSKLREQEALADKFTESYRSISASGGTYANEAFIGTRNWQQAFWGSNYAKLAQIKAKVDPNGVLYCPRCVGSEKFVDNAGQLCRV